MGSIFERKHDSLTISQLVELCSSNCFHLICVTLFPFVEAFFAAKFGGTQLHLPGSGARFSARGAPETAAPPIPLRFPDATIDHVPAPTVKCGRAAATFQLSATSGAPWNLSLVFLKQLSSSTLESTQNQQQILPFASTML